MALLADGDRRKTLLHESYPSLSHITVEVALCETCAQTA